MNKNILSFTITFLLCLGLIACNTQPADNNSTPINKSAPIEKPVFGKAKKTQSTVLEMPVEKQRQIKENLKNQKLQPITKINKNKPQNTKNGDPKKTLTGQTTPVSNTVSGNLSPDDAEKYIDDRTQEVLTAIASKNYNNWGNAVHPTKGVRLSTSVSINTNTDLTFTATQIKKMGTSRQSYTWGIADGSGEPINLNFAGYYSKYIYNYDYKGSDETKIAYNEILGTGNSIDKRTEVYPNAIIVEYHIPGVDPKYGGMDWSSLILAYEQYKGKWYLVGIIHNGWTI